MANSQRRKVSTRQRTEATAEPARSATTTDPAALVLRRLLDAFNVCQQAWLDGPYPTDAERRQAIDNRIDMLDLLMGCIQDYALCPEKLAELQRKEQQQRAAMDSDDQYRQETAAN